MKIQIISDLHLVFEQNRLFLDENPIQPVGDVLVIAGDIADGDNDYFVMKEFLEKVSKNYKKVIACFGNHEFYFGNVDFANPKYDEVLFDNVYLLNNSTFIYDNVRFIVSTLWSNVPEEKKEIVRNSLNDYRVVKNGKHVLTVEDTNLMHKNSVDFIQNELKQDFEGKTIVVTHHMPTFEVVEEQYKDSTINSAFVSELKGLIKEHDIDLWVCGHSHSFDDRIVENTRIVRNPLGYVEQYEYKDFKRDFVIDLFEDIYDHEPLSDETLKSIKRAEKDIKEGRVISESELKEKLGL